MNFRCGLPLVLILLLAIPPAVSGASNEEPLVDYDWGFIVSRYQGVEGETHTRSIGPIWAHSRAPDGKLYYGIRPFFSSARDQVKDRSVKDFLWPVASVKRYFGQRRWQFAVIAYGLRLEADNPESPYRVRIFPIWYQGRTQKGQTYAALFPLGGKIHDFLFLDEVEFVLFPVWVRWTVSHAVTTSWFWPIISHTDGETIDRSGVFPFYGEADREGISRSRYFMWPFYSSTHYESEGSTGDAYIIWPLWGRVNREQEKTLMLIPPLFRFTRSRDGAGRVYCPWPIIQWERGPVNKFYIWPLWGRREIGDVYTQFWLWPMIWNSRHSYGEEEHHRFQAVPFVINESDRKMDPVTGDTEIVGRYCKLWPLYSYRREGSLSRFRLVALWPFRDVGALERNWTPLWSLFTHTRNETDFDTELLWGLYRDLKRGDESRYTSLFPLFSWSRNDVEQEKRSWSFLKGLLGYEREGHSRYLRLLFFARIPLGGQKELEP